MTARDEYSVCQFFTDGSYEYVRRYVSAEEAVKAFKHYAGGNVASKMGIVERVIITNGGDMTNLEWRYGKGFSYDGRTYHSSPRTEFHNIKVEDDDK
jgi:hypothetical protein